jgi:hypothetical protein
MTHLRVFEDSKHRLFVELTPAKSNLSRVLFVRALREDSPDIAIAKPSEIVRATFHGETISIAFLTIVNRDESVRRNYRLLGVLEETDSINVLNNILDVLAFNAYG